MTLKTIIFDLGNVIIDIDSSHTERGLAEQGIQKASDIFTVEKQNDLCDRFERGEITPDAFIEGLSLYSMHDDVDFDAVRHAWEAMILDTTPQRLQLLQDLRHHYTLYLLSNTNEIHHDHINQHFQNQHGLDSVDVLFDKAYFSYQVGMRKPTADIFQHVLNENQLNPKETLFIDDLDANIQTARALDIQTWHADDCQVAWNYVETLIPKNK